MFECPVCGTRVGADAATCPGCGAQFAEEEVPAEKFECPLCGVSVDASATKCPGCGVEFEEEVKEEVPKAPPVTEVPQRKPPSREVPLEPSTIEREVETVQEVEIEEAAPTPTISVVPSIGEPGYLRQRIDNIKSRGIKKERLEGLDKKTMYRELPRIVNEVKPLLLNAKKIGVNIEGSKQLINFAIAAGKKREMEKAVQLVSEAKAELHQAFIKELTNQLETLTNEVDKARAGGSSVATIESMLDEAITLLEDGMFQDVANKLISAKEEFTKTAGGYYKANQAIVDTQKLIDDSAIIQVDLAEANKALVRARDALRVKQWDQAEAEARRAKDYVMRELPVKLTKEMKQARDFLLDMKVKGGDLTKPIGILKQASIHLKREEYQEAVHYVRLFRQEVGLT